MPTDNLDQRLSWMENSDSSMTLYVNAVGANNEEMIGCIYKVQEWAMQKEEQMVYCVFDIKDTSVSKEFLKELLNKAKHPTPNIAMYLGVTDSSYLVQIANIFVAFTRKPAKLFTSKEEVLKFIEEKTAVE